MKTLFIADHNYCMTFEDLFFKNVYIHMKRINTIPNFLLLLVFFLLLGCSSSGSSTSVNDGSSVNGSTSTNDAAPTLSYLYPATTYAGASGQTLTLVGSGFANGAIVKFNGISREAKYVSSTHLTAELTTAELSNPGTFSVNVTNPASGTSANQNFTLTSLTFGDTAIATPDWTADTHGKLKTAAITKNLSKVFDTSQVQRMDITIDSKNWAVMQSNLAVLSSQLGGTAGGAGIAGGAAGGAGGGAGMAGGGVDFSTMDDPIYVPCDVLYNGKHWYRVGIRFKGNSSLYSANSSKLPLKLKFNEFAGIFPAITDQRFYGFKTLSLKSNFRDESEIHELVVSQLYRDFGLKGPHTSFYKLYVDHGDGSVYYGLYTLVEEVDDTVIKTQYADDSGNLYKPEGNAATFAAGTFNTYKFGKKSNESALDYSDVQTLYDALNSDLRLTAPATWKANLEKILDVPVFLKWLAANTVLQNWDTYGIMPHNYLLYRNPATQLFEWIPWDNNEALVANQRCLSLSTSEVTSQWPLIRYVLDDAAYALQYRMNVHEFASSLFNATRMTPIYTTQAALIQDAVLSEISGYSYTSASMFTAAISALKSQVADREAAALAY
jgi:spore coat protein CotH